MSSSAAAGIWHLVDISIVGVDRVPYHYYQAKLQAERLIHDDHERSRPTAG